MPADRYVFQRSDLVGGHVVLDLVNTVTGRTSRPTDWLEDYDRVLEWAALTDAFDPGTLDTLGRLCARDGRAAARALRRVRELREALYDVIAAAIRAEPAPKQALSNLERHWKSAVNAAHLTFADGRTALRLDNESSGLDYPRHLIALSALDLTRTLPVDRTRECASPRCTAIFLDSSRGGQRRWCDMATCGNQAKSRRHYERKHHAR
jgi:predicted RNA-binding Zn ribbon-like protein